MKTDKTKLLHDIKAMKEKLASMEEELNKPEVFKHFPSKFDTYHYYTPTGVICSITASDDDLRANTYKTRKEAHESYNKAVAIEKVKRRLLELQGDWKPDFNGNLGAYVIYYSYFNKKFDSGINASIKHASLIPYIKTSEIVDTIIKEMDDELKLIFDIA